jgi:hypothetical protein
MVIELERVVNVLDLHAVIEWMTRQQNQQLWMAFREVFWKYP